MDTQHLLWKLLSVVADLARCLVQMSPDADVSVAPSARADPPIAAASPDVSVAPSARADPPVAAASPDVSVAPSARADPPVAAALLAPPWHLESHSPWSIRDP